MKVIENNFDKSETNEITKCVYACEHCNSKIEVSSNELNIGVYGSKYFKCPCCKKDTYIDDGIELTKDNIEYPKHFNLSYLHKSNINIDDYRDEITKEIRHACKMLWDNQEFEYAYVQKHGIHIFVFNMSGDGVYEVYVCKDVDHSFIGANPNDINFDFDET